MNPKKLFKKSKKLFTKLMFSSSKNKDENNNDFNDEINEDNNDDNISIDINKNNNNNILNEIKVNDFVKLNKSTETSNLPLKKNIKNSFKKVSIEPYKCDKENINLKYISINKYYG